jgi:hypothetical protein
MKKLCSNEFYAILKINTDYFPKIKERGERPKKEQNVNERGGTGKLGIV